MATFDYGTEQPVIHQRNRVQMIAVKAAIATGDQPATIAADLTDKLAAFTAALAFGCQVEIGGTVESSADSQAPIAAVVPRMVLIMALLILVQMQGIRLSFPAPRRSRSRA